MKTIVYIETTEQKPLGSSLELLTAAAALGEVKALLVGEGLADAAKSVAAYGVAVLLAESSAQSCDEITAALETVLRQRNPQLLLLAGTQLGKDLAPRLAERFESGCITDAIAIEADKDGILYTRPAFGGTVLEHLTMHESALQVATVRAGSYPRPAQVEPAAIETISLPSATQGIRARLVDSVKELGELVDLEGADVIVAGGRGMGDAEHFRLVEELAALLGGVVGATRPAIEEGWISRSHQIGQSGKIVSPRLYIACGISGAMQHISGVLNAKYILAINSDEDASIFNVADLGIVGDAKEILPVMIEEIRKKREG